jgi:peptidyl-prolyl cis-trans isomerase D
MLQQMRRLPKWVGFLLFLPLAGSFVVWGVADVFKGGTDTSVATVGGTKIDAQIFSRDFTTARRNATPRGTTLSAAKSMVIGQKVLQEEISNAALDNAAEGFGITTTNDEVSSLIRTIPGFQGPDGSFSQIVFEQALQRSSYTPESFVAEIKQELKREQVVRAGASAAQLPPGYTRAIASYLGERRAVQYMVLPPDAAGPIPPPSDAVLTAFVKARANLFSTPEFRQITYAVVTLDDAAKKVQVTDAQIRQAYDLRKDTFVVPERRDIQQITFPDEASAKAARAKIDGGAKFEDIATQRGVSAADLNLGTLAQADLGPGRGPAAFALLTDGISQPVKYTFGWVLLRVTKITPAKTTTFDQAKLALHDEILKQLAASRLEDIINDYGDAQRSGADMVEAAKKVGMRVVRVPTTDAHGLAQDGSKADVPASPDFMDQVFKSDVGNEGDPFRSTDGNYYVVKVEGIIPQKLKPLDAVRAQAVAAWTDDQQLRLLEAKAAEIAKEAGSTGNLEAIAHRYNAVLASSEALIRSRPTAALNQDIITKIFSVPGGKAVSGIASDGKTFVVARVTGILHVPVPYGDPELLQLSQALGGQISADIQDSMGKAARAAQGVKLNQSQVDHILGGEGS